MTLKIARGFGLPVDAVTETFAILAKRGAGKTYTASVVAEEMLKAKLQTVVLDPMGAWWGLRSSADGKGPGFPLAVLGGPHGDVPLESTGGLLVADLIVDEAISAIVDVSDFSKNERRRFVTDFVERLYQRNRDPMHVFIEEADLFAPQGRGGGERENARMLGAMYDLVRRGRGRGIGSTLITQRSASISKEVLEQAEILIALRTTGPRDRAAIEGWISVHGEKEQEDAVMGSLPSLPTGTAWVWWPVEGILKRVNVRERETFDSSATPKVGEKRREPKTVADVDLAALQERMAATIEKAKATDPKELTRRIRELELEVQAKPKEQPAPEVERVEIPVLAPEVEQAWRALSNGVVDRIERVGVELRHSGDDLVAVATEIRDTAKSVLDLGLPVRSLAQERPAPERRAVAVAERPRAEPRREQVGDVTLGKGERKVLAVLRQWPDGRTYNELAFLAGYSAKASTLGVILSKLRQVGYVEPGNQPVRLTPDGLDAAGGYEALPSGGALLDHWRNHPRMGSGERTVLQVLVEQYPNDLSNDELCGLAGYSPIASTMGVILSKLRKLGLVEKGARRLAPEFAESIGL